MVVDDQRFAGGVVDGDGFGTDAVLAGVAEESGDRVEAHGLVVDEAGEKLGGMVDLEPAGGVGDEGKGDGVALGKAVEGEGADCFDDFILHRDVDIALRHAETQSVADGFHAFVGTFEGHGAAQFIGFGAIEAGDDHGHAENLFLKERNAEGARKDGFEGGVDEVDGFAAVAAVEVGMDEVAHDGTGTDESDLDGEVVEILGLHDGQGGHLGAGLDLEGAHGVGAAEKIVGGGIVVRNLGEVDRFAALVADTDAVFHGGQHAEAEEIHFDDAEVLAVVLVPLYDGAVGHGGRLQGDDGVESVVADDHASGVLAEMTGEGEDFVVEMEERFEAGMGGRDAGLGEGLLEIGDPVLRVVLIHGRLRRSIQCSVFSVQFLGGLRCRGVLGGAVAA